jgi:hypothetical protein
MRETTTNPRFSAALHRMEEVHNAKSHDYATDDNRYANFEFAEALVERFGDPHDQVFATMVGIKIARLGELLGRGKTPKHESIDDSFLDLANYAVLWWTSSQQRRGLADGAAGDERVAFVEGGQVNWAEIHRRSVDAIRGGLERPMPADPAPDRLVDDGTGHQWLKCGPKCDLHMTSVGHVGCRCEVGYWTCRCHGLREFGAEQAQKAAAPTRTTLEQEAAQQPLLQSELTSTYINDGLGRLWLKCSPTCDLHLVRPGQVTCRCHGHSDDSI